VAAEESLQGWISLVRRERAGPGQIRGYQFLQQTIETLASLTILSFDDDAAAMFQILESLRLRIGTMDLKIAAICLAHDATLLTRNLVDFEKVPGLKVENWLD
jgi:tRNA(fMet)-specific endonuclease VapC